MRPMLETLSSMLPLEPLATNAIRSTALIAIAALVTLMLRRAPAAIRHLVWTLALIGCIAMPLASRVVPGWALPGIPAWGGSDAARDVAATGPSRSIVQAVPQTPSPAIGVTAFDAEANRSSNPATSTSPSLVSPERVATSSSEAVRTSRTAPPWQLRRADVFRIAPMLWLAGVILLLGRYIFAWRSLSRVVKRATALTDTRWQRALARHATTLGLARLPALRISADVTVPMVFGAWRPTVLLPSEAVGWTDERRDAVLLHELAHVRRFDLLTSHVTRLAPTLYWFNPIVWIAVRQQRTEAERACDDQVLDAGGRASAYASDLVEIATAIGDRERFGAAALAMARRSQLEGRLLAILDPKQPRGSAGRVAISLSVLVAAASIGALAAARPVQSQLAVESQMPDAVATNEGTSPAEASQPEPEGSTPEIPPPASEEDIAADASPETAEDGSTSDAPASTEVSPTPASAASAESEPTPDSELLAANKPKSKSSWSIIDNGSGEVRTGTWTHENDKGRFKAKGTIRYSPDLDDIVSISPGGYVEMEDRRDGHTYEATFKGRSSGIERSYSVDGEPLDWDDDAREWLHRFLIDLDHGSGTFVEQRFPRLMSDGGPARVLREIALMTSDYGRSIYFHKLFTVRLDEPTMRAAVAQAGREISSDYELARTLIAAAEKNALENAATRTAYLEALGSIESDYEHARVLLVLVARRDLSIGVVEGAIASASRIDSDYEQARVMMGMVEKGHIEPVSQRSFIRATQSIESDYEKGRVLRSLIEHGDLSEDEVDTLLGASDTMESDYEHANVLVALAESASLDEDGRAAFVKSAEGMSSDYERKRALAALGALSKR